MKGSAAGAASSKAARIQRYHGHMIPGLRLGLCVSLFGPVWLHQAYLAGGASWARLGPVLALVLGYALATSLLLRAWYRRPRSTALGEALLVVDFATIFTPIIYATGGAESWIFFLPVARVLDRLYHPVRRTLVLAHLAPLSFLGGVWATVLLDGARPNPGEALVKATFVYFLGLYVVFVGRESHRYRRRLSSTLSHANALSAELEEKNQRLSQYADEVKALARLKGEFVANVSHEIRTPLNGIIGMTTVLGDSELDAPQRQCVDIIRVSSDTLLALVNDVLDFSKIEAGRLVLEHSPYDPRACARDVVDLLRRSAHDKGLALAVQAEPDLPAGFLGDVTRMRQVLANLVGNAVKFTEAGGVTVRIASTPRSEATHDLTIEVRDTGPGIAPDRLATLFEPFTQADASTTRRFGGTGLGLTITRRLVEAMGGRIDVQSAPDRGSTFSVTLPADVAPSFAPTESGSYSSVARPATGLRVLVADDNGINQKVALRLLEPFGYEADVVSDGAEAVAAVLDRPYDVVLMDVLMPTMDGLAATRTIRREAPVQPWIIAMTANAMKGDREACLGSGMDDYLAKPLRRADLQRAFSRVARPARPEAASCARAG